MNKALKHHSKKLLIVEDQPSNLLIIRVMLDALGYKYDVAINGAEAVEKFIQSKYSIILMDIEMPVMSGYEASTKIRALESEKSLSPTPIIILTANPIDEVKLHTVDLNIAEVITKPFTFNKLSASISACEQLS